ncbi:MAG: hypothetical protein QM762_12795 [Chryseolinea sp.]
MSNETYYYFNDMISKREQRAKELSKPTEQDEPKVSELRAVLDILQEKIDQLHDAGLKACWNSVSEFITSYESSGAELTALRAERDKAYDEGLRAADEHLKSENVTLQGEVDRLEKQHIEYVKLNSELAAEVNRLNAVKAENAEIKRKAAQRFNELTSQDAEILKLKEQLASLQHPGTADMPKKCPYCGPDGTQWNGDGSRICPHCKGAGVC